MGVYAADIAAAALKLLQARSVSLEYGSVAVPEHYVPLLETRMGSHGADCGTRW